MASRFEPIKSGTYAIEYKKENGFYEQEIVNYDRRKNSWIGKQTPEFYKENVSSWCTVDNSSIYQ